MQPPYPWRGRISCDPAPERPDTVDGMAEAGSQVASFLGQVQIGDLTISAGSVFHAGISEWSYRRMIFHYARLAQLAGGVDMFLIGSEMRGLTRVRDEDGDFPFIEGLADIARDVAPIVGNDCIVTYGADWSEYFGYQPQDGTGDVFFNLDQLWAVPEIGAVGIDNYMPLSDWRDGRSDYLEGRSGADISMLARQVSGAEGFDWYYANAADRQAGTRTPITDGLGKPWVFRYKDLSSWWNNLHFERVAGQERPNPTAWQPRSKPIIFTEFGCPAIHNGPAQPNVFYDPKSSESAAPYFSNGGRDDDVQLAYLQVHQAHWNPATDGFEDNNNPQSDVYAGRMVDFQRSQLWAWDARPYPAFPTLLETWSDGDNWHVGHWLNGRLGAVRIAGLLAEILADAGIMDFDVSQVDGTIMGYVITNPSSVREMLDGLLSLYRIDVCEKAGTLVFRSTGETVVNRISGQDIIYRDEEPALQYERAEAAGLPDLVRLSHTDPFNRFQSAETTARRAGGGTRKQVRISLPMVAETPVVEAVLAEWIQDQWTGAEVLTFRLPLRWRLLTVGDTVDVDVGQGPALWKITRIEEGDTLAVTARAYLPVHAAPQPLAPTRRTAETGSFRFSPFALFLDLPVLANDTNAPANRIGVSSKPWPGEMAVYVSASGSDFEFRQNIALSATTGRLEEVLPPATISGRWQRGTEISLTIFTGVLSSANPVQVLNGSSALALKTLSGRWEVIQFQEADLVAPGRWVLRNLLRGQAGTEEEALAGAAVGADVVLLNEAVVPLDGSDSDRGKPLNWLVGPVGSPLDDPGLTSEEFEPGFLGERPYRPVHLRVLSDQNGMSASWIRRDRVSSDAWEPVDIVMSEANETYRVVLSGQGEELVRIVHVPDVHFDAASLAATFGASAQTLDLHVAQVSATYGAGVAAHSEFNFNP